MVCQRVRPEAKAFRKWVTNEVLPELRKKGSYGGARQEQKAIPEAGTYLPEDMYAMPLRDGLTYCALFRQEVYTHFNLLLQHIDYTGTIDDEFIDKIGRNNFIIVRVGIVPRRFINLTGYRNFLKLTKLPYFGNEIKRLFEYEPSFINSEFAYQYTSGQMNDIVFLLHEKPLRKDIIMNLLRKGRL